MMTEREWGREREDCKEKRGSVVSGKISDSSGFRILQDF